MSNFCLVFMVHSPKSLGKSFIKPVTGLRRVRSSRTSSPRLGSQTLLVGTKGCHQEVRCCLSLHLLSPGCCGKAKQIPVLGSTHHRACYKVLKVVYLGHLHREHVKIKLMDMSLRKMNFDTFTVESWNSLWITLQKKYPLPLDSPLLL